MKFDLYTLEWQQFEVLTFRCLQEDISKSIQFIEGGSDKGRDIIFSGFTSFFGKYTIENDCIFQVKHKSNENGYSSLKSDLKKELDKIYVKHEYKFDLYCLVTNLQITGSQYDELEKIFDKFLIENNIQLPILFRLYTYRNFEAVVEKNNHIKWSFPSIVKNTDFQYLLDQLINKRERNLIDGWIEIFKNNKNKFINTSMYERAIDIIETKNLLLLSGPPKSGKTFTGEMVVFNKMCVYGFTPYKIDSVQDFENFYNIKQKQIFLFDDTFGKYNLDVYKSDIFDRKIEYILRLLDENHKCIFTSREYIYIAFKNYSDKDFDKRISKITIEVSSLSAGEKESLFRRYFSIAFPNSVISDESVVTITKHENFTPETIRSYFQSVQKFSLIEIEEHLRMPNNYLEKIFINLNEDKRLVLLSVLFSKDGSQQSIAYCYQNIINDLNLKTLSSLNEKLHLLDGSIIRSIGSSYLFYHPSMNNFLLKYLSNDLGLYRSILFRNINLDILNISLFKSPTSKYSDIIINFEDLENFNTGLIRMIRNPFLTINEINSLLTWLDDVNIQWGFKLIFNREYMSLINEIKSNIKHINYERILIDNLYFTCEYFNRIKNIFSSDLLEDIIPDSIFKVIITFYKKDPEYWRLVFSIIPFLRQNFIYMYIDKIWLRDFVFQLKTDINSLGVDLFGDAFPEFPEVKNYHKLLQEGKYELARKIEKWRISDYLQETDKSWYTRYKSCKDRMAVLKNSPVYGYKIYLQLSEQFYVLKKLEINQKNRHYNGKDYDENQEWAF